MARQPAPKKQKTWRSLAASSTLHGAFPITPANAAQVLSETQTEVTRFDGRAAAVIAAAGSDANAAPPTGSSATPEMGVIEEIYCENFMCHRKLRVTLSPHINFITGENGSGKSAIIAAIQICFGASARTTHRGKNIKSFIRHGCDGNAFVRVTLRNDDGAGSDAFQADKYGKKIIVERLIRRDGSAEYRLKSEKGMLVSKLKSELEAMMDHLNIQTDNPCAVLDQDNAKLFLKGTSQDKYKFFLQPRIWPR
ncbi:structural maintenance of chromosomes protein, putative [Phytophthora infestans T30-4]|uniref:Structural maintenance of chromosomes protein, putative n=2 Tax=Phytophthora infestans TaxID=4787 RepID=D0NBA3_PHYIT|nr:structural maintenance of chromosomes protein, putative [Phytophthora infestans T30-4]EEY55332.1 structural maintenance of chromosomes protein, putative [Phytophthora infestans T30-4]KAF4031097.1 ATPase family associated domain-containing protein 23 [Phytophthora infestans]KAF4149119.1 AAA domain [Phytophthora infestans]|eukprot:XP_002903556.1 structural maintenance of chromosomes protein, putative [Phytophthora infestans T30-4]